MDNKEKTQEPNKTKSPFVEGFGLDLPEPEYQPSKLERFRYVVTSICGPVYLVLGAIGIALLWVQTFLHLLR